MTSERKKSLFVLALTLLAGILIGLLVPGLFHKLGRRGDVAGRGHGDGPQHKREWFLKTMNNVIKPDSTQAPKIRAITERTATEIDSLEHTSNLKMIVIFDSLRVRLKPVLTGEQQRRLEEFDSSARLAWKKGGRRH